MSGKSIIVLLLVVGLLLSGCQRVTPNPGSDTGVTPTEILVVAPPTSTDTLEPTVTSTASPSAALTSTATLTATLLPEFVPIPNLVTPTITSTLVVALVPPFKGWPAEYQVIKVPPGLQKKLNAGTARIVPLPQDKTTDKTLVARAVLDRTKLNPFNLDRLASFKDVSSFVAVPARSIPEKPDFRSQGLVVGLVYDQNAFYGRTRQAVYQVVFFDKKAEVRDNATGGVVKTFEVDKDYFWVESESNPEALTFFIKNGCWLCWNAGGRTGCLICF